MRLVKVKQSFYDLCKNNNLDNEVLFNENGRPCVLILKLMYKNEYNDFILPLRSNISPNTPKCQYFNLPPNKATKPKHHHGIHYIKLFPINRKFIDKYLINNDKYYIMISSILDKNEKQIIECCQDYLIECEKGNIHQMTPDIDGILNLLKTVQ